jgi:HJR/Mrr/RecB family endonuclease
MIKLGIMKKKTKKSSPVWLIIILGAIIFLLQNIITAIRHNQQLVGLRQELETVSSKAAELEQQRQEALKMLEQKQDIATASSLVSPQSTYSAQPEPQVSTFSGETPLDD